MINIPGDPLCYLATPYTRFPDGIEEAFRQAAAITGQLIQAGIKVYSPIVYTHPLAQIAGLDPLDQEFWLTFDVKMMEAAQVLIVAEMPSWRESDGIKHEIAFFAERKRPIFYLDPGSLAMATVPWAPWIQPPQPAIAARN